MKKFQHLKISCVAEQHIIDLLEANVIGTPGESMVYKHDKVKQKVLDVPSPYFANLSIRDRLYGTICLSKRVVYNGGIPQDAFYLRYFTFRENLRIINPRIKRHQHTSSVRKDVALLMDGHGLDFSGELLLYAYVDPENIRSKRLTDEFGFEKAGDFQLIPFSRLFTKKHKNVAIADKSKFDELQSLLKDTYQHEQLVSYEYLFRKGKYFYIEENGQALCGVQAIPDIWQVLELPGFSGKMMLKVVPHLPILKRLFNPTYRFAFLESIFCLPGHERKLEQLFESVLEHYQLHSAILCIDRHSKIYSQVKQNNMGLTHKLQGEKTIDIVVKSSRAQLIHSNFPFSVSAYDVL